MRQGADHDVLIVGAGLAGLWAASGLARRGIRVLLVDRKREVSTPVATTGIFVRRSLESFDLPEDCLGPPVRRVKVHSPSGRVLELESRRDEFRVGRMGRLYQKLLAQAETAGVAWSPMTHFAGCEPWSHGSRVFLRRNGQPLAVTTRFVMGADGARSRVARALSLDRNFAGIVGVEDVLVDVPLNGPPCFHCFLDPEVAPGYLGWLVHDGAEVHLGVAGDPARFEARQALEKLRARAGRLVPLERGRVVERRGGWIPVNGMLRTIVNPRGMLLGDAAGRFPLSPPEAWIPVSGTVSSPRIRWPDTWMTEVGRHSPRCKATGSGGDFGDDWRSAGCGAASSRAGPWSLPARCCGSRRGDGSPDRCFSAPVLSPIRKSVPDRHSSRPEPGDPIRY